ncbi:MAG TPA: cytochrome c [Stellaceae bacterium]|jgi:mono/diheme cytochrome c family protein|nr:cytochrome c [Stellaceae bacterium]
MRSGIASYVAALTAATAALIATTSASVAETALERGTYLMSSVVACGNCHTPKGPDGVAIANMELSGGDPIDSPVFHAVPGNITPDKDTGIGNWTDDQIVNAIRNGKKPDGTIIGPPMPIPFYHGTPATPGMSDSDVKAIVAYLRSVKPINHQVEKSTYKIPLPASYGPPVVHNPEVSRTDHVAYGKYLASGLGHCMDCHTPDVQGRPDFSKIGAGGNPFGAPNGGVIISANLTPGNPSGIAGWTNQQIKVAITTGMRPDRPLVRLMAFDWYKNISNEDLNDLIAFLHTLKPVKSQ